MSVMKQMHLEELDRNADREERLSEMIAREDEVGFKESKSVNLELIEAIEQLKQKYEKGE